MIMDEYTQKNAEIFENLPYHKFIGLKVVDARQGYGELRVPVQEEIINSNGVVHGGIYYTICDLAAASALWTMVNEDNIFVTSDINISVVSSTNKGELTVKAQVLKMGKRLAFLEARVTAEDDELIAVARITKTILPKKK